jgi:hypothetical protein
MTFSFMLVKDLKRYTHVSRKRLFEVYGAAHPRA